MKKIKKIFQLFILLCFFIVLGYAAYLQQEPSDATKITAYVDVVIDGDTIYLNVNDNHLKCRLLLVDTPEIRPEQPYGLEAKQYLYNLVNDASLIQIQYQTNNEVKDKYDRDLVWLFVDGKLVQTLLAKKGYVKSIYDNGGNYDYIDEVYEAYLDAKENHIGLYSLNN